MRNSGIGLSRISRAGIGLAGLLSATVLGLALLVAPGSARAATITMSEGAGAGVSIIISIEGIEALAEPSLGSYDFDLTFDDAVLSFASVDFGPFLGAPADSLQDASEAGGVVDFAEVSLIFPNVLLQDLQPDSFVLATINFDSLVTGLTTTRVSLTQTSLSDGNGAAISIDAVSDLEFQAAIPEVSGAHVFGLGLLVVLAGHSFWPAGRTPLRQER